jgi:hypothetical protein
MTNALRDENQVTSALGSYAGTPVRLKTDHVTGYLKVKIYPRTFAPPVVSSTVADRDENQVSASLGSYNGTPKPLLVTHADSYLRVILS